MWCHARIGFKAFAVFNLNGFSTSITTIKVTFIRLDYTRFLYINQRSSCTRTKRQQYIIWDVKAKSRHEYFIVYGSDTTWTHFKASMVTHA